MIENLVEGLKNTVLSIGMVVFAGAAIAMVAKERYSMAIPLVIGAIMFALFLFAGDGFWRGLACQVQTWAGVTCQ